VTFLVNALETYCGFPVESAGEETTPMTSAMYITLAIVDNAAKGRSDSRRALARGRGRFVF